MASNHLCLFVDGCLSVYGPYRFTCLGPAHGSTDNPCYRQLFFNKIQSTPKTLFLKSRFFDNTHPILPNPTFLKKHLHNSQHALLHWKKVCRRELVDFLSSLGSTDYVRSGTPHISKLDHCLLDYCTHPTVAIKCAVGSPKLSRVEGAVGVSCFGLRMDADNRLSHSILVRIHIGIC